MSLAITIDTRSLAAGRRAVDQLERAIAPEHLRPIVGRAAANTLRTHLQEKNVSSPNRLGGARTNFYAAAARSISFRAEGDTVTVSISHIGIRQRYYGGTIRPVSARFLAIPAVPEAHGKRPGEFSDLQFVILGRGGPALIRRAQTRITQRRDRRTGLRRVFAGKEQGGEVVFWLRRSVTQQPDPSVLPTPDQIETHARTALDSYIDRQLQRATGPDSAA